MGAITCEEREAPAYDEEAVLKAKQEKEQKSGMQTPHMGCPGTRMREMNRNREEAEHIDETAVVKQISKLRNWPVEIKLAPIQAPYFQGAKLFVCGGLYRLCLCMFSSGFYQRKSDIDWLSEVRCSGLQ